MPKHDDAQQGSAGHTTGSSKTDGALAAAIADLAAALRERPAPGETRLVHQDAKDAAAEYAKLRNALRPFVEPPPAVYRTRVWDNT